MNAVAKKVKPSRFEAVKKAWRQNKCRYILLIPAVLVMFVFRYLPFAGVSIAFMDYNVIDGFGSEWVGFQNFIDVFADPGIWVIVLRTLKYSTFITFVAFPFPILLALMFNELNSKNLKRVAQTLTYLPHFLSMITVVGLFYQMLSINGTFNNILGKIIGESYVPKNILLDSEYFLPIIFSAALWKGLGWSSIVYISAIAGIDGSLYEAAAIDGCGRLRQAWYITIPGISGTIVLLLVMKFGNVLSVGFELVNGFQNLYTQNDTDVISTFVYRNGIVNGNYSQTTAFGLADGLVSLTLIYVANKVSKKLFSIGIW